MATPLWISQHYMANHLPLRHALITGANIHACNRKGLSAPHDAANNGQVETIEILISASEDCEAKAKKSDDSVTHCRDKRPVRGDRYFTLCQSKCKSKTDDGRKPIDLANAKNMPHSSIY